MTNPNAAVKLLIVYAIIIPVAILLGYLLTNPLDYGTIGFVGVLLALLVSPVFLKWHYPIMLFGLACPAVMFFLPGRPPMWELVVIISFIIAIAERILSSDRQFVRVPVMTWSLIFIAAAVALTAKLTGGIQFHSVGGTGGGGKKYVAIFLGIALYFALTSRAISPKQRKLYLMLFFLPGIFAVFSSLYPYLPSPLNYINLLFPPLYAGSGLGNFTGDERFKGFTTAFSPVVAYLLARYGLRGILTPRHAWRFLIFVAAFALSMLGGFRSVFGELGLTLALMFFMEKLHHTRLLPVVATFGVVCVTIVAAFSNDLPYPIQRAMCFLPLKWDTAAVVDAQGSSEWRFRIWHAVWPKVPDYLLLGKGYALNQQDYEFMGRDSAFAAAAKANASLEGLAISSDFHNGPLSTLIPFGVWGAIGIVWLMSAALFILYRNYRFGDSTLQTFNIYMLAAGIVAVIAFFFIFGAFQDDVGNFAKMAGFSLAMNGGLAKRQARVAYNPAIKPKAVPEGTATGTQAPQPAAG